MRRRRRAARKPSPAIAAEAAGRTPRESLPEAAEQLVPRLPVVVVVASIGNVQSVTAEMSMYCPSQKSPPAGCPHFVVQALVSVLTHDWLHATFAWRAHDPPQRSWHLIAQSIASGCSWQPCVHSASQLDEQYDAQSLPVQPAMHPASQAFVHSLLHVTVGGVLVQAAVHLLSQARVQLAGTDSVHIAPHVAV
jgi:hypothetical protein